MQNLDPVYWANRAMIVAQDKPGSQLQPVAPPGVGEKVNVVLNWAYWLCFAAALVGVMMVITGVVMSRRDGASDEVTTNVMRVGVGVAALAGVGALFAWFVG